MQSLSPGSIEISPASHADTEALSLLFDQYRQFYGYNADLPLARRFIGERLTSADSHLFVARLDFRVCGFVQCYPGFASLECRPSWLLSDLFVAVDVRGLGVGRALLQHVWQAAEAAGCCVVELFTAKTNGEAQRLYESEGYRKDREFLHYELFL